MRRWLVNVGLLVAKELRSVMRDYILMALIVFAFTAAIVSIAHGIRADVSNASVAVIDDDRSQLSRRLRDAILPPYFKTPVEIPRDRAGPDMDAGRYIFVVQFPPRFEADVLAGRRPGVQVLVDATAMTQAGLGAAYFQQIFLVETLAWMHSRNLQSMMPLVVESRLHFNPNNESSWFTSVMQIVTNITILSIILVGAAVIREREHGTIEHLLVMPVRASEIAMGKILANGLVILVASMLSLWLVVHLGLGVPITGSWWLFAAVMSLYLFSTTALGMWLATLASTMPQFGLLVVPVYAIAYLLSGAATPVENMPVVLQGIVQILPTTQFVALSQAVLYRGAGAPAIAAQIAGIALSGALFLGLALSRFRSMLARQG
jgi:ABC-2 type transport system permease protein